MKRILAIDGGGIRGLLPARILDGLEANTGKRCDEIFDLIAGTSTGGIIGCGLAIGLSAKSLADMYAHRGSEIFSADVVQDIESGWGVTAPKYDPTALESILKATLGAAWLSSVEKPHLLVPSMGIDPYGDLLFRSWEAADPDHDFRLWEVARATSAAETYFPAAHIASRSGKTSWNCDGGTFANDPTLLAVTYAGALWPGEKLIVLSLGTGRDYPVINGPDASQWGDAEWAARIAPVCIDGSMMLSGKLASLYPNAEVYRIETDLPADATAMDDASPANIARLEAIAAKMTVPDGFLAHLKQKETVA